MLTLEHAVLLDICLGFSLGKIWFPNGLPQVDQENIPGTFVLKGQQLAAIKQLNDRNDSCVLKAVEGLRGQADCLIEMENPSVVQKQSLAPGAILNDFCSLSRYWWPNPQTPDGLPYIFRPGEENPASYSEVYDTNRLARFSEAVLLLSLTAYLTGDSVYAAKACSMLDTWFVHPVTRQSPHFRFAQIIPGKNEEHDPDLVEGRHLVYVCESLQLLRHTGEISEGNFKACAKWFAKLLDWFEVREQGRGSNNLSDRTGFWEDVQRIVYARFCGRHKLADSIVRDCVLPRFEDQIEDDGRLPLAGNHGNPCDYNAFTLMALAEFQAVSRQGQVKPADYPPEEGRYFQKTMEWFHKTLNARGLQEKGFSLVQLAALQRQLAAEKGRNQEIRQSLQSTEEALRTALEGLSRYDQTASVQSRVLQETESGAVAESMENKRKNLQRKYIAAERECSDLRSQLQDTTRNAMIELEYFRAVEFLLKERTGLLLRTHNELQEAALQQEKLRGQLAEIQNLMRVEKEKNSGLALHKDTLETRLKKLESDYKAVKMEREKLKKTYKAISKSRIWRFTYPIRKLGDALKSVIRPKKTAQGKVVSGQKRQKEGAVVIKKASPDLPKPGPEPMQRLKDAKPENMDMLKEEYKAKGLDKEIDDFVLYRIIGNDLYPRHKKGQSRENLQFILEHESEFGNCEKRWVVNRIIDKDEEQAIVNLLQTHNEPFIHIPFHASEYKKIAWDTECLPGAGYLATKEYESLGPEQQQRAIAAIYRLKNNYVMNNNGARNAALRDGKKHAKWILPWDGNCFITASAWEQIRGDVLKAPYLKYYAVPMARVSHNEELLSEGFKPDPVEEPQIIFRRDAREEFNEEFCYGRRPKVELFWRLGIPGKWDSWKDDPWDLKRSEKSAEAGKFGVAGWVARLFSGMESLEKDSKESFKKRGTARLEAILSTLSHVDAQVHDPGRESLACYRGDVLNKEVRQYHAKDSESLTKLIGQLVADAEEAIRRGTHTVTEKTTLPPSQKANDYWHPAPYWWPNPQTGNGLPYIRKDGERIKGTQMYEPESDKYDRTRLQYVFDDSIVLALAWKFTGEKKYAEHGVRILERFFLNPDTRITPHLEYAQVRMGHNKNRGLGTGIIEAKDFYCYLDAVRLFAASGSLSAPKNENFREWLSEYLLWLTESPQGKRERKGENNHGTYYDLQVAAISDYLGQLPLLHETLMRAQSRISQQFTPEGVQPREMNRTTSAHYCCYNFQGWVNLAEIAYRWGVDLWAYSSTQGSSLIKGAQWLLSHIGREWPYEQIDRFDTDRFFPIWFKVPKGSVPDQKEEYVPGSPYNIKPRFFPHDGIQPYWNLGSAPESDS